MQLFMNDWFKAARKKLCSHSDKYTFIKNGKTFSGTRCNPYTGPATALQVENRTKFAAAIAALKVILADDALKASWRTRYQTAKNAKQTKASSLNGYLMQQYFDDHVTDTGEWK